MQMEGPISPAELVEILQRTIEEHELALRTASREREIKIANRQLREEQDAAYLAALQLDKVLIRVPVYLLALVLQNSTLSTSTRRLGALVWRNL